MKIYKKHNDLSFESLENINQMICTRNSYKIGALRVVWDTCPDVLMALFLYISHIPFHLKCTEKVVKVINEI